MNADVKKLWVEALRSGSYKQGRGALRKGANGERYCCLGVLCDLHAKATGAKWRGSIVYNYMGYDAVLPTDVVLWADLENENPTVAGMSSSLAKRNDEGATFAEIADLVETL